jgi:MFS family permease
VWTVGFGIGLALVGRLSDIFGRRWFFISATVLALIGNIVACRCQSVNELIGANAIIGLAAAGQLSYNIVIGELVPNRDRGPFNGLVLILSFPFNVFAPIVARLFILHTEQSWRWGYYIGIILNGVGCILWYAFYHPPTYDMLHIHGRTKLNQLRHLDWMGILLFVGGLAFFLIGVSRGGVTYPWRSVQVLTPFLIGFATLVGFCLWEGYAKLQSPLMPMRLFTNLEYVTLVICASIGVMVFYSMLVLWPVLVGVLFETELINIGYVSVRTFQTHFEYWKLNKTSSVPCQLASQSVRFWAAWDSNTFPK